MNYRVKKKVFKSKRFWRFSKCLSWFLLALFVTVNLVFTPTGVTAENSLLATDSATQTNPVLQQQAQSYSQEIEAQKAYQAGKYSEAAAILERALEDNLTENLTKSAILTNLALTYQQLGEWTKVGDLVAQSEAILEQLPQNKETQKALAATLEIKGRLQLVRGERQAIETWAKSAAIYQQLDDEQGVIRSQIDLAQGLQSLGFYRRATKTLRELNLTLQQQPNSLIKAVSLRSLGNSLQTLGELDEAQEVLTESLEIAQNLESRENISATLFSLGNLARSQQDYTEATNYYQQIIRGYPSSEQYTKALLNQLSFSIETENWGDIRDLLFQIENILNTATITRPTVYATINYAQSLMQLQDRTEATKIDADITPQKIRDLLIVALTQARQLEDKSAEAYALGNLGRLYELEQQWESAQKLTQQALAIAQEVNAQYITYQWQWQLGRILKVQNKEQEATLALRQAVNTLQSLRSDLVTVNPEIRFSFRESVEPIYREYVSLLLQTKENKEPNVTELTAAREAIDSLQLAELENFFRATCLNTQPVLLDEITDRDDPDAAIIYPIVLADRIEIIVKLPQQQLRHYTTTVENTQRRDRIIQRLPETLTVRNSSETLPLAQQVYDWLISPAAQDLADSNVKTLVFVLDSSLRGIPMSVLHDGQQYLVEKYAVALAPGLQLIQPQPIAQKQLRAITAGLTEARDGFPPLQYVARELNTIQSEIGETDILLNSEFTSDGLKSKIAALPFPIVHLATHGQFSSQIDNTFILAWDERIDINQLRSLLQNSAPQSGSLRDRDGEIELLVLSACQTVSGDKRAALGLAGVAVRAGARSTLGSLWKVNDEATSLLMSNFYQVLSQQNTKAKALRQAQLSLLNNPRFDSPFYWASFVLLGNWL